MPWAHRETPEVRAGRRVRQFREQRGWSQTEVARRMAAQGFDMHQTTLAKLEAGSRPTRLNEYAALTSVLDVNLDDLLREDGPVGDDYFEARERTRRASARLAAARAEAQAAQEAAATATVRLQEAEHVVAACEVDLTAARDYEFETRRQREEAIKAMGGTVIYEDKGGDDGQHPEAT